MINLNKDNKYLSTLDFKYETISDEVTLEIYIKVFLYDIFIGKIVKKDKGYKFEANDKYDFIMGYSNTQTNIDEVKKSLNERLEPYRKLFNLENQYIKK